MGLPKHIQIVWPPRFSMSRIPILDDRGQERWVQLPDARWLRMAGIPRPRRASKRLLGWLPAVIGVAGSIAGSFITVAILPPGGFRAWTAADLLSLIAAVLAMVGILVSLWGAIGTAIRPGVVRRTRALLLSQGRCPWCTYDLSGGCVEPDQCVVCPECGGAWRRVD